MEITGNVITPLIYSAMEKMSGPNFHIYVLDFDKDGYLDVAMPNHINNTLIYARNPGSAYWRKIGSLVYQGNKSKMQQEFKTMERWK